MDRSASLIGDLSLPLTFLSIVNEGRWKPPENRRIREVFGDDPDGPQFYDLPTILRQNRTFQHMSPNEAFSADGEGIGIVPSMAVLIGDLGTDMPIALDYRVSRENPRVLYLGQSGWTEVARDFADLAARLYI